MKNLISKVTLLLLCSVFTLSSCDKTNSTDKETVTLKYQILVSADTHKTAGANDGGLEELYKYMTQEMNIVSEAHNKQTWTITETADTKEAAIAACDKKAIAEFDKKLSAINTATASIKTKFDAKKAELLSKITIESSNAKIVYNGYGGHLFRGEEEDIFPNVPVKEGNLVNLSAVGGEK